ncbi:MAG: hypothetical protein IJU02_07035 [Lachnospiraceae bacterium]|nr:hypothetical protein [Lachnospiraceae bacterium]
MNEEKFIRAKELLTEIKAINSVISCLRRNYKDACEKFLYDVIYAYKDKIMPILEDTEKELKEEFDKL